MPTDSAAKIFSKRCIDLVEDMSPHGFAEVEMLACHTNRHHITALVRDSQSCRTAALSRHFRAAIKVATVAQTPSVPDLSSHYYALKIQ
jgi:hypothetical protein